VDKATRRSGLEHEAAHALAAIVRSSDDAIYSKDRNAIITSWNPAAEKLYGYTAEEAIGRPISILIPGDRKGEEIDILERVLAGDRVDHYETVRVAKDGHRVDVSVSVSPVRDASGIIVEAAVIARDVSERKQMEAQLEAANEAQAAANRKQALLLNDAVVQGLAVGKLALETGKHEEALKSVGATLERAKKIVTSLLSESGDEIDPGDLVRDEPVALD